MGIIIFVFRFLCQFYIVALLARAILSWFVNPYNANQNGLPYKLVGFLNWITEPMVIPARKLLSNFNTGPIDFSLFVAMIFIYIIRTIGTILLQFVSGGF